MAPPAKKTAPKSAKPTPVGNGVIGTTDAAIGAIYNQLVGQLEAGQGATQQNFDRTRQLIGSSYDQSQQLMKAGASNTVGGLRGSLNALGLGDAVDSATQGVRNQFNQGLVSTARRRVNDTSGIAQQGAGYMAAGRIGIDNTHHQEAQARSDSQTILQKAITEMEAARAQAQGQVDVARVQGEAQLEQMKLQFAQAQADRAQAAAASGGQGDPLLDLKAQSLGMDIMRKQAQLDGTYDPDGSGASTGGGDGATKYQAGYDNYLVENGASPIFKQRADEIINAAYAEASRNQANGVGVRDPYTIAMEQVGAYGGQINQDRLRAAIQVMFGKVG